MPCAARRPNARALKLTQSQYAAGVALRSDVALAQEPAGETTQAAGVDLGASRAQLVVYAIAVLLLGQAAGSRSPCRRVKQSSGRSCRRICR